MTRLFHTILIFSALLLAPTPILANALTVITEHVPPYNYEERGLATGIFTDIFLRMADHSGLNVERADIRVWPWARGYREIQQRPNVILFAMARSEPRDSMFQWIGPVMPLKSVMITNKGDCIRVKKLAEDTTFLKIGTVRDNASQQFLLRNGVKPDRMQCVHELTLNIKKLIGHRIDAAVGLEGSLRHAIRSLGHSYEEFDVVYTLFSKELYFAASHDMDPAIVQRLQAAFDDLKDEGVIDIIIKRYLH